MAVLKLRMGLFFGPNLLSAGLYPLRDWWTLFLWPLDRHAVAIRLPVRAVDCEPHPFAALLDRLRGRA